MQKNRTLNKRVCSRKGLVPAAPTTMDVPGPRHELSPWRGGGQQDTSCPPLLRRAPHQRQICPGAFALQITLPGYHWGMRILASRALPFWAAPRRLQAALLPLSSFPVRKELRAGDVGLSWGRATETSAPAKVGSHPRAPSRGQSILSTISPCRDAPGWPPPPALGTLCWSRVLPCPQCHWHAARC